MTLAPLQSRGPVRGMAVPGCAEAPAGFRDESVPEAGAESGPEADRNHAAAARWVPSLGARKEGRLTCRPSPRSAGLHGQAGPRPRSRAGLARRLPEAGRACGPPPGSQPEEPRGLAEAAQRERLGGGAVLRVRVKFFKHLTLPWPSEEPSDKHGRRGK